MESLVGIENLKKAVKFGIDLSKQIEVSGQDGFDWKDSFSFFDELMQIPGIIASGDKIKAEFNDLQPEEKTELLNYFKTEFDLADDKLETIIESSLELVLQILTVITLFRKPTETGIVL